MKRLVVTLTVVAMLAIGAVAFAHGPGWWGGGPKMGAGYGAGYCYGPGCWMRPGHMMGWGINAGPYGYDQKFLNETRDLRKQLHDKRFEYFEALRNPETTPEIITKLEKEITELQQKIFEKAPRTAPRGGYGWFNGPGWCWR